MSTEYEDAIERISADWWQRANTPLRRIGITADDTYRTHMHTAYRAKTRRRNRRTK
jgi:hypothetical protein